MGKKFLFYLEKFSKPIAITDPNEERDINTLIQEISKTMNTSEIYQFSTDNDGFVVRTKDLIAFYITETDKNNKRIESPTKNTVVINKEKKEKINPVQESKIDDKVQVIDNIDKPEEIEIDAYNKVNETENSDLITEDILDEIDNFNQKPKKPNVQIPKDVKKPQETGKSFKIHSRRNVVMGMGKQS